MRFAVPKTFGVISCNVIEVTGRDDRILVVTDITCPFPGIAETLTLEFSAPEKTGFDYAREHFPCDRIRMRGCS